MPVAYKDDLQTRMARSGVKTGYRKPPPAARPLKAYAADVRWRKETGGVNVNGVSVATDRQSQAMITGAHAYVASDPRAIIKWKSQAGFVSLDAAQITALALAVGAHVQACFAKEQEVVAAIDAGTITTHAAIDKAFAAM